LVVGNISGPASGPANRKDQEERSPGKSKERRVHITSHIFRGLLAGFWLSWLLAVPARGTGGSDAGRSGGRYYSVDRSTAAEEDGRTDGWMNSRRRLVNSYDVRSVL
jgi:hypothetical protein